jgi:hypothetical protein
MLRQIEILVLLFVFAMAAAAADAPKKAPASPLLERGKYLLIVGGCHDCHTPWKMGPKGPEPEMARMLMGHPQGVKLPPPALPPGPWDTATGGMTAWAGPWGISYAANLTPDKNAGLGSWSEAMFIEAMQTGRHWGKGRPILPPMPWRNLSQAKVEDLKAIFAYLQSIPAISNRVPDPAIKRAK